MTKNAVINLLHLFSQLTSMFSTLLPLVYLLRKCLTTPHLSLPVITSLLCTLNLGLKLPSNAEPTNCSLHSLQLIK